MARELTNLRSAVIAVGSDACTATKRAQFSYERLKRLVPNATVLDASTVGLPVGRIRKVSTTDTFSPECAIYPTREHAILKSFQEIPVSHPGYKIPDKPGGGCCQEVILVDPRGLDKIGKNL